MAKRDVNPLKAEISWDQYFMGVAFLSAKRSKDPKTKVGACVVNKNKRIVSTGYNGMPDGCHDDLMSWLHHSEVADGETEKSFHVCHAEMNAILNKNSGDVRGCKIYVTLFPCHECAKIIIQSGIKKVVYAVTKPAGDKREKESKKMLQHVGVKLREFKSETDTITIDFTEKHSGQPTDDAKRGKRKRRRKNNHTKSTDDARLAKKRMRCTTTSND